MTGALFVLVLALALSIAWLWWVRDRQGWR